MNTEPLPNPYFFNYASSSGNTSSNSDSLILDGSTTEIVLNQNHYIIEVSNSNVKKITLPLISSYKYSLFYIIRKISEGDLEIETSGNDLILTDKKIVMSESDQVLQVTNNKNGIWFII